MSLQIAADVTVLINSETSSSERRVSPSWTISQLKTKLHPITGIPQSAQQLTLRLPHAPQPIAITSNDEDATLLSAFPLQKYAEIHVRCPVAQFRTSFFICLRAWARMNSGCASVVSQLFKLQLLPVRCDAPHCRGGGKDRPAFACVRS